MIIKQISIFIENRRGRLSEIADLLGKNGINMCALSIADTTHFGILRIIVDKPQEAEKLLRENDVTASVTDVIAVSIEDRPGGLAAALRVLADNDVSVEYMYAYVSNTADAYVVMRVGDNAEAVRLLTAAGFHGLK